MVDAVWEDISDGSQRIYCQLPYSRLTHVDPMWEDMSDGSQRVFCQLLDS